MYNIFSTRDKNPTRYNPRAASNLQPKYSDSRMRCNWVCRPTVPNRLYCDNKIPCGENFFDNLCNAHLHQPYNENIVSILNEGGKTILVLDMAAVISHYIYTIAHLDIISLLCFILLFYSLLLFICHLLLLHLTCIYNVLFRKGWAGITFCTAFILYEIDMMVLVLSFLQKEQRNL